MDMPRTRRHRLAAALAVLTTAGAGSVAVGLLPGATAVATAAPLTPYDGCAPLLAAYRAELVRTATAYGPRYGWGMDDRRLVSSPMATARAGAAEKAVGTSETGTNVQEAGVDEADGVKLLGDVLLVASNGGLRVLRAGPTPTLLATVALGGDYARVRTDARLAGQGGTTKQVALYYADGTQMHDFRTLQDHVAPKTYSDLLFKGAVQDTAKSVYTGLIRIREEAKGSVAYQTNRNLTLSEGAWAESVPNLDIKTNDVKCSHASTVGPIDEEQRFYLESRGIQPDIAERLVVLGFFDEVLSQLPTGGLAAELRERISHKLHQAVVPV